MNRVDIQDLHVGFNTDAGFVHAVKGVNLEVEPGEILALVGESGSGKTVTARSVLGLLGDTAVSKGAVLVEGNDVTVMNHDELRKMRGRDVSMIFQEPSSAMNPVFPIWWQMAEGLKAHNPKISKKEAKARCVEALRAVGIPEPEKRINRYPHEFSGGQKQRIMIAMAVELGANTIVADEPTTALDVTVQAEILQLLRKLRDERGTSIIIITHNMGVVADLADSVAVMYHGKIIERAPVRELFANPREDYTKKLLGAVPRLGTKSLSVITPAAELEAMRETTPVVEADGLEVTYPGRLGAPSFTAVKGVSFQIHKGEVFGLVGESGSGKTTIGRSMVGLEKVTGGSLKVLGKELNGIRAAELRELRKRVGFVFQDPATSCSRRATRTSCRVVSASASRSPAALCSTRSCSLPTSPPPPWTSPSKRWCWTCSNRCSATSGSRPCSSATTWPWWTWSPTPSACSTTVTWSNAATARTLWRTRSRPTRSASSVRCPCLIRSSRQRGARRCSPRAQKAAFSRRPSCLPPRSAT